VTAQSIAAASTQIHDEVITAGRLTLDHARRSVTLDGMTLVLKAREYDLFYAIARANGRVLTRAYLLATVWPEAFDGFDRTVDVHVRRIREVLESADPELRGNRIIVTVHGVGYRFGIAGAAAALRRAS
jgi:DNA-binding response OmpR family regulator